MFAVFWQELRQLPAARQERVRADERELLHEVERMVKQIQHEGGLAPGRSPAVVAAAILLVLLVHLVNLMGVSTGPARY